MSFCSQCGHILQANDHYCAICGTKVVDNDLEKNEEMEELFDDIFDNADPEDDTTAIILMNIVHEIKEMKKTINNIDETVNYISCSLLA